MDLHKLGEQRRLIFSNIANGVPKADVGRAFNRSETEIDREVAFVAKKIREARFRLLHPPIPCQTERDIRFNRLALLDTLRELGSSYLASDLALPNIAVERLDNPNALGEARRRLAAA